jgi:hypothetical protein
VKEKEKDIQEEEKVLAVRGSTHERHERWKRQGRWAHVVRHKRGVTLSYSRTSGNNPCRE